MVFTFISHKFSKPYDGWTTKSLITMSNIKTFTKQKLIQTARTTVVTQ